MTNAAKDALRALPHAIRCMTGYRRYRRTGETPDDAYKSLRKISWLTDGRFNRRFARRTSAKHNPELPADGPSVLGDWDNALVDEAVRGLDADGYFVLPGRLSDAVCDRLLEHALRIPGHPVRRLEDNTKGADVGRETFCRDDPQAIRHQLDEDRLMEDAAIQDLSVDPLLYSIARGYLRFNPVLDRVSMWWTVGGFEGDRSVAAQKYHIDMDRFRFINVNVYLTDVGPKSGPHCLVRGTHRRKPRALRRDGRIEDDEIEAHYPPSDLIELTGARGTVSLVDTSSLHKGKAVETGDRLMLQIRYSDSTFGQNYAKVQVHANAGSRFATLLERAPGAFPDFVASGDR